MSSSASAGSRLPRTTRHGRWTPALRARFLGLLAASGDVKASAAACGLSRQSVYKLRRKDSEFAREWNAVLVRRRERRDAELAARFPADPQSGAWRRHIGRPGPLGEAANLLAEYIASLEAQARHGDRAGGVDSLARTLSTSSTVSTGTGAGDPSGPS